MGRRASTLSASFTSLEGDSAAPRDSRPDREPPEAEASPPERRRCSARRSWNCSRAAESGRAGGRVSAVTIRLCRARLSGVLLHTS